MASMAALLDASITGVCVCAHPLLSRSVVMDVFAALQRECTGHEKVAAHACRALGSMAAWAVLRPTAVDERPTLAQATCVLDMQQWEQLVLALSSRVVHASSPKTRWNACFSLGNVIRNASLLPALAAADISTAACQGISACSSKQVSTSTSTRLTDTMMPPLIQAVGPGQPNFKVRITAAQALAQGGTFAHYGSFAAPAFAAVLASLADLADSPPTSFDDFKYQETLRMQLELTVLHLLGVVGAAGSDSGADEEKVVESGHSGTKTTPPVVVLTATSQRLLSALAPPLVAHQPLLSLLLRRLLVRDGALSVPPLVQTAAGLYERLEGLGECAGMTELAKFKRQVGLDFGAVHECVAPALMREK